jgi:hypothetical protein
MKFDTSPAKAAASLRRAEMASSCSAASAADLALMYLRETSSRKVTPLRLR